MERCGYGAKGIFGRGYWTDYKVLDITTTTEGNSGEYIKIDGNSYYDYGFWETGEDDDIETSPELYVTKPVDASFNSPIWGTNKGQTTVTVPAGSFTAWLFQNDYTEDGYTCCDKHWLVPYLGLVKVVYTESQNGSITWQQTGELASYAKNATLSSSLLNSSLVKTQSAIKHKGIFH